MHFRRAWLYYSSVHSHFNDCSLSNIYDALGSWRVSLLKLVTPGLCLLLQRAGLEIDWLINYLINQQQQKKDSNYIFMQEMTLSCSLLGLLKPIICLHPSPSPFRFHYIHNSPLCLLPCISNISILLWICSVLRVCNTLPCTTISVWHVRLHLQNTQHALFLWCPHSCCCPFWSLPKWSSVSCLLFSVSKSCITGLITQERTLAIINIMIKYICICDYLFLTKKEKLLLQLQLFLTMLKPLYCVLEFWQETLHSETKSEVTSVLWCLLLKD